MKKVIVALMMAVAANTASFAMSDSKTTTESAAKEVVKAVEAAPAGTTYGVEKVTKSHVVVNTPLGRCTIDRNDDGSFSFLGVTARIASAKNGVYEIQTTLGNFCVNTKNVTITKK